MARNSNQSGSNSEQEPESRPETESSERRIFGFKADVLTRIAAVAVFVVIGSFAVVHSLRSKPSNSQDQAERAGEAGLSDSGQTPMLGDAGEPNGSSTDDQPTADSATNPSQQKPDEYAEFGNAAALGLDAVANLITAPERPKVDPNALKLTAMNSATKAPSPTGIGLTASPLSQSNLASKSTAPKPPQSFQPIQKSNDFQSPANASKPIRPIDSNSLSAKAPPAKNPDAQSLLPPLPQSNAQLNSAPNSAPKTKSSPPPPNRFASANPAILGRGEAKLNPAKPLKTRQDQNTFESPQISNQPFDPLAKAKQRASNAINNMQELPVVDRMKELGQLGAKNLKQAGQEITEMAESGLDQAKSLTDSGRRLVEQSQSNNNSFAGMKVDRKLADQKNPGGQQVVTGTTAPNALRASPGNQAANGNEPPAARRPLDNRSNIRQPASFDGQGNSMVRSKSPTVPATSPANNTPPPRNSQVPIVPVSSGGGFPPTTNTSAAPPRSPISSATQNTPGARDLDGVRTPALAIQRLSPSEVQVNQTAEFTLIVKNIGRVPVDNVQVYDRVPAGAKLEGSTPQPQSNASGQLQWNLGTMKSGDEKRIVLRLTPTQPGELGSVAQVTFASRASLRTKVTQPILEVVHRSQPKILIGDKVVFDVTVTNKGDGPARNVVIQEDVPGQLVFQNGYREIEYDVGTLPPGQSRNVRLQLVAKQAGKLKNVMFASAEGGLKAKHELDLEIVAPVLKVKSEGPVRRFLGRNVTHQISLANEGTATATNLDLVARLPRGLRFVSANNQGRYVASAHAVYWNLAQLPVGTDAGVELKTTPIAVGNHPIKVESTADLGLKDEAEQPFSIEHLVDVFFDIDDVVDPIEIGSETRYRVEIVNQGSKTATNVQLQVEFPNGLKPTAVSGPLANQIRGQAIQFEPIASLQPGQKINLVLTGLGQTSGDHRVSVTMKTSDRQTPVVKEETTRVYSDR